VTEPHNSPLYKSVLAVYSLRDKRWKLYGDFCFVGSSAFSPDGNKVAFKVTARSGDARFVSLPYPDVLLILDLRTGQVKAVPDTATVMGNRQLSWSPDGQYLAVSQTSRMEKTPGVIVLIQVGSWVKKDIAIGENPSWSPKGDWIAYQADWGRSCTIVHPDGTGSKTVVDLRGRPGGWLLYDWIGWSADEDRLLFNEEQFDGPSSEVTMVNLINGELTTKSKRSGPVLGWAAAMAGGPGPTDPR
jgi:Tol biopolymer transport system component